MLEIDRGIGVSLVFSVGPWNHLEFMPMRWLSVGQSYRKTNHVVSGLELWITRWKACGQWVNQSCLHGQNAVNVWILRLWHAGLIGIILRIVTHWCAEMVTHAQILHLGSSQIFSCAWTVLADSIFPFFCYLKLYLELGIQLRDNRVLA